MVIFHSEDVESTFDGTIIDIETIGEFCREYQDSRLYRNLAPVIFGYLNKDSLNIYCAKKPSSLKKLQKIVVKILPKLERPFYAFNCCFETGVLFHAYDIEILFDHELNEEKWKSKRKAVQKLNIGNYDDPFYGVGRKCKEKWEKGDIEKSIAHNRSCLLKERDIFFKRGYRNPDELILYKKKT